MSSRTIKLLHVEDDVMQQELTAQQLATMPEFTFAITGVDNEDGAVAEFQRGSHELIILDYHLNQGDGLSCLRRLRQQDRIVPIIALSGKATPEIAAELLQVGADDYLSKTDLTTETLVRSIREALARADAWHRQGMPATASDVSALFQALCRDFAAKNGPELVQRLDQFEAAARRSGLTSGQMQVLFETVDSQLTPAVSDAVMRRLLRPLFLEILLRLFGEAPEAG